MPFLETSRGKFFYLENGNSGPVVYLLHGLTAKCQDWGDTPRSLVEAGFHVFSFDMRGHGQSVKPETGFTPEDYAADVEAWAQALGHAKLHVVGHSTGGRNALTFAAFFPWRALSLTVIDQTFKADPESWKKYKNRFAEYPAPFADEKSLEEFLKRKFPGDKLRFDYFKGQFAKREDGRWDWNFSPFAAYETQRLGRMKDAFDWLPMVKCPALFIKGGDSVYVPMEEAKKIESLLPRGKLAVVEKAEHAVFRDNPRGFLAVLLPFLKSRS